MESGSDNRRLRQQEADRAQACPRPRRPAAGASSLHPPGRPPTLRCAPSPPLRHATPLSRVVPAVRPSDFGRNPGITAVLEHERRMRTAEGGLYPWCRATAPSSTSVEYRWSCHGPAAATRATGRWRSRTSLLPHQSATQPRRRHSATLLHGGTAGLPGMQYIAATFSSMLRLSGCPSKLHDGVALGAAEQLDRLEQLQ